MRALPGSGWRSTPTTRHRSSLHSGPATAWSNACPATAEPGPATTQTTTPGTTASSGPTPPDRLVPRRAAPAGRHARHTNLTLQIPQNDPVDHALHRAGVVRQAQAVDHGGQIAFQPGGKGA